MSQNRQLSPKNNEVSSKGSNGGIDAPKQNSDRNQSSSNSSNNQQFALGGPLPASSHSPKLQGESTNRSSLEEILGKGRQAPKNGGEQLQVKQSANKNEVLTIYTMPNQSQQPIVDDSQQQNNVSSFKKSDIQYSLPSSPYLNLNQNWDKPWNTVNHEPEKVQIKTPPYKATIPELQQQRSSQQQSPGKAKLVTHQEQKQQAKYDPNRPRKIPKELKGQYYETMVQVPNKKRQIKPKINQKGPKPELKKAILENIQELELPQLKGKTYYYFKDPSEVRDTLYFMNYVQIFLPGVLQIQIKSIQKIKVLYNKATLQLKVTYRESSKFKKHHEKDSDAQEVIHFVFKESSNAQTFKMFSGIIVRKFLMSNFLINEPFKKVVNPKEEVVNLEGEIFRKTRIFGNWEKQKMHLTDSLYKEKDGKMYDPVKKISQLWSRFDMHNGYFVIKVWDGPEKLEFGIPLMNYTNITNPMNWLYGFYRLLQC